MDNEKEDDIFALNKPNELPAYPKHVHIPTGEKYPNGADICKVYEVKNPDEHKALLAGQKGAGKKDKEDKKSPW